MTADRRYKPEGEYRRHATTGCFPPCDSGLVRGHYPVLVWLGEWIGNLIRRMRQ